MNKAPPSLEKDFRRIAARHDDPDPHNVIERARATRIAAGEDVLIGCLSGSVKSAKRPSSARGIGHSNSPRVVRTSRPASAHTKPSEPADTGISKTQHKRYETRSRSIEETIESLSRPKADPRMMQKLQLTEKEILLVRRFLILARGKGQVSRYSSSNLVGDLVKSPYLESPGAEDYSNIFKSDINKVNLEFIIAQVNQNNKAASRRRKKAARNNAKALALKKSASLKIDPVVEHLLTLPYAKGIDHAKAFLSNEKKTR